MVRIPTTTLGYVADSTRRPQGVFPADAGLGDQVSARYFIDTGVAIHRPQTEKIRGRKQARSIHGYFGRVLTREQALGADVPLCERCFPQGFLMDDPPSSIGRRADRIRAANSQSVSK